MSKVIMVQGTMSNAGKSLIVAGLCRVFKQDGYKVAPFKSQNMALNSFVTEDGLEMGRAQVMQAEAAGVRPDVYMNPILLKPTSDVGSQVIVNGEVVGNMPAREYFEYKKSLVPVIKKAFTRLSEKYDIIVIEGAGSPAEINLKENDIVNMGLAEMLDAPVLLVGDIDRGGVFAQLYGTYALLPLEERNRIKGFIINKFRGDASLLDSGIDIIEDKCGIPVVGVVPYTDVRLADEDSLAEYLNENPTSYSSTAGNDASVRSTAEYAGTVGSITENNAAGGSTVEYAKTIGGTTEYNTSIRNAVDNDKFDVGIAGHDKSDSKKIDIAVIRYPRVSNFTDFDVFRVHENVNLRFVSDVRQLGKPDMIILPGSKNTMGDLMWLRRSGLGSAILNICRQIDAATETQQENFGYEMPQDKSGYELPQKDSGLGDKSSGIYQPVIFGICGGFQMLGQTIEDPYYLEEGGMEKGLGLLPIETVVKKEKTRKQVFGELDNVGGLLKGISGKNYQGYEIHMGHSRFCNDSNIAINASINNTNILPNIVNKGNVYGTYIHGIFDEEAVRDAVLNSLAKNRGITINETESLSVFKEKQYDKLADVIREFLDMDYIYSVLKAGEK